MYLVVLFSFLLLTQCQQQEVTTLQSPVPYLVLTLVAVSSPEVMITWSFCH